MQSRPAKQKKEAAKHQAAQLAAAESPSSVDLMLAMVGERKKVLDISCAGGHFAQLLSKRQCDVVGIEKDPRLAEEARRYCTKVIVADLDAASLGEVAAEAEFDVIVFGDVLSRLKEPVRVLDEARSLLADDGFLVASIPNVSHGSIRLALLSGRFDYQELGILNATHLRFFTPKTVDELLVSAGYRVEALERVSLPIFDASELVPQVSADEFDAGVIADIRNDPESETLQLVLKAFPLSNEQRVQSLLKRFLLANTELAESRRRLERREQDLELLSENLASRDATVDELRKRVFAVNEDLNAARTEFLELEDSYRRLELRHAEARENAKSTSELRVVNTSLEQRAESLTERLLAVQTEQSQEAARTAALRIELAGAIQAREILREQLEDVRREPAGDDRYVAEFESELAAQRRLAQAEADLRRSLEDVDREHGRVLSLEDQLQQLESHVNALTGQISDGRQSAAAAAAERSATVQELEAALEIERGTRETLKLEFEATSQQYQARSTDMVYRIHELEELHSSADARAVEAQSMLEAQIARVAELQETLAEAQSSLSELAQSSQLAVDHSRTLGVELQAERSQNAEIATRIAALEMAVEQEREQLAQARRNAESAAEASQLLSAELDAERSQNATLQSYSTAMSAQIAALEIAVEQERELLAQARRDAETAAEASLSLNAELDAERAKQVGLQSHTSEMSAQIAALEVSVEQEREQLAQARRDAETAAEASLSLNAELDAERAKQVGLQSHTSEMSAQIAALEVSVEQERVRLAEAQRNAESHEAAASALRADLDVAREKHAALQAEITELDRTAKTDAVALQALVDETRSQLEAEYDARVEERAEAGRLAAELKNIVQTTRSELSSAADRVVELQSHNAAMAARNVELQRSDAAARSLYGVAQGDLDRARAQVKSLEDRSKKVDGDLDHERVLRAHLETILEEQRERFGTLELYAMRALEESEALEHRLEQAWFDVYAELEEVRSQASRLEAGLSERSSAANALERTLAETETALQAAHRAHELTRAESTQVRDTLAATHSALRDSREQAAQFSADVAILKVRAVKAEQRIPEFERHIEEGAEYARRLETEIAATRKAALAERIVMRDYADEIRSRGEEQIRTHVQRIEQLTEQAERGRRELEQLQATSESDIQKLQAQIANVTAYGEEMRDLLSGAERRLLDQAEDTIADMQAESAQLVLLIDTVQSSHFWKLKRWLGRLLGRNRR